MACEKRLTRKRHRETSWKQAFGGAKKFSLIWIGSVVDRWNSQRPVRICTIELRVAVYLPAADVHFVEEEI